MPRQMSFFLTFNGFISNNFEFPPEKSFKIFAAQRILWDTNFKHEKSRVCKGRFSDFRKFDLITSCEKTSHIDFPKKQAPTKVKRLLPVCQISRNFTEGNARKLTVSFVFRVHVDVIKCRKTLTFCCFERAQITWAFVLSACAIVKLYRATLRTEMTSSPRSPMCFLSSVVQ